MSNIITDRYRRWFEYEKDAHAKALASLHTVPESRRQEEMYQQAVELFGHLTAARKFWLHRLGVLPDRPRTFFPKDLDFKQLEADIKEAQSAWDQYFSTLDDAELARVFEYRSSEGDRYSNTIEDILTQLFGHSLYHRGQIASRIKLCGGVPAATDFIFYARELLPGKI